MSQKILLPHTGYDYNIADPQSGVNLISSTLLIITDVVALYECSGIDGNVNNWANVQSGPSIMNILSGTIQMEQELTDGAPIYTETAVAGQFVDGGDSPWRKGAGVRYECIGNSHWRCLTFFDDLFRPNENLIYQDGATIVAPSDTKSIIVFIDAMTSLGQGSFVLVSSEELVSVEMSEGWAWAAIGPI